MPRVFVKASEWAKLSGRHKLAVAVVLLWGGVTLRIFSSFDPAWFSAQAGNYSTLTIGALGFAAASLGLQRWADVQLAPPPAAGQPG